MATTLTLTVTNPENPCEIEVEFKDHHGLLARVTWDVVHSNWSGFEMTLAGINHATQLIEVLYLNVPAFYPAVNKRELVRALDNFDIHIQNEYQYLCALDARQSLGLF